MENAPTPTTHTHKNLFLLRAPVLKGVCHAKQMFVSSQTTHVSVLVCVGNIYRNNVHVGNMYVHVGSM